MCVGTSGGVCGEGLGVGSACFYIMVGTKCHRIGVG